MSIGPAISVIVPTHNRRASVCRTLAALAEQSMTPSLFEVIVVADGCTDDTAASVRSLTLPFPIRVIEQPAQGQGKARNVGAESAAAPILVFLDDDIVPLPRMLEAYQASHHRHPRHLVLGPAVPVLAEDSSLFAQGLRNWWNDHLQALKRPSHRFTYRDMHSGNFSIAAALFAEAGGFDPAFAGRSGEDYELGVRLMTMGIPFVVAWDATAYHHDGTDLKRSLVRVRKEGRADILIGLRHPELRGGTALSTYQEARSRRSRMLRNLAFHHPGIGDRVARVLLALLPPLERLRARGWWRKVHGAVRTYWYCRGAAEELGTSAPGTAMETFLEPRAAEPESLPGIDLADGLTPSMRALDLLRPRGVRVLLAGINVGVIPAIPGAEAVRGDHLPDFLAGEGCYKLLLAMSVRRVRSGTSDGPTV